MVVPLAARLVIAIVGALLVLTAWGSVIGTLIVPRPAGGWLTHWVDRIINAAFRVVTSGIADHKRRDRVLAAQAAAILLAQLVAWLGIFFVGYSLLLWPFVSTGLGSAFSMASPGVFGPNAAVGNAEKVFADLAAFTALVAVTLQIAYLPTLYSEFNRRENEVSLLNARAGVPSWGPELLARTHYALGSGASTIDTLPDLYAQWERWAADVAESHTTYLPLVRFRSPKPLSSWVTALLAVLDSAALYLAGTIVAGAGFGVAFLGALRALSAAIPSEHRGSVMSAFYVVAYASLSLPAILAGVLDTPLGLRATFEVFGSVIAVLALIVALLAWRTRPRDPNPADKPVACGEPAWRLAAMQR